MPIVFIRIRHLEFITSISTRHVFPSTSIGDLGTILKGDDPVSLSRCAQRTLLHHPLLVRLDVVLDSKCIPGEA